MQSIYRKFPVIVITLFVSIMTPIAQAVDAVTQGLIPISNAEKTARGQGFSGTAITIFQQDILPFIELGGAGVLLFVALNGLWKGYREYQHQRELDPLKHAIVASVILIVVGGAILYLIDQLRSYQF